MMRTRILRQSGVAVVTALLITTLAVTLVATLFWQQQVQLRTIENQRLQLQKKWVMRGAIDWARLILREDAKGMAVDHLGEPWAVRVEETPLSQYVEEDHQEEAGDTTLSGFMEDAQAHYNLNNLVYQGVVNPLEVQVLARLLEICHADSGLAQGIAGKIAAAQNLNTPDAGTGMGAQPGVTAASTAASSASIPPGTVAESGARPGTGDATTHVERTEPMFVHVEDILDVPGVTPDVLERLRPFISILPRRTPVNLNTAPAEVLQARIPKLGRTDALAIVASRNHAFFTSLGDFKNRFPDKLGQLVDTDLSVSTQFFFVNGRVRMSRSTLAMNALVERLGTTTRLLWIRDY